MARMTSEHEIRASALWFFETARFFVGFYAEEEETDPADSFTEQDDIDAVRSGSVDWFCARVSVFLKSENAYDWEDVGSDYLGGCAYKSAHDFYRYHTTKEARDYARSLPVGTVVCNYFPDMVKGALREARNTLRSYADVNARLRAA